MADQVDVRSVEALEAFEGSLGRAQDGTQEFLVAARAEISTVLDWITEREHDAQRAVSEAEDRVSWAHDGLSDCENSSYDDDEDPPDCSGWQDQVSDAGRELEAAMDRREEVRRIADQVRNAAEDFLHSARQLNTVSAERMRVARLYLQAKTRELRSYLAIGQPSAYTASAPGNQSATSPTPTAPTPTVHLGGSQSSRFSESGIVPIEISDIPNEEIGQLSRHDFHKYSYDEMLEGVRRFDSDVMPAVAAGSGREYFQQKDREAGLGYERGLERLYDAFYGSEPIRITKLRSGRLEVSNGRHRLFVAKQAGIRALPVSLVEEAGE